jgi:hypothetical protein
LSAAAAAVLRRTQEPTTELYFSISCSQSNDKRAFRTAAAAAAAVLRRTLVPTQHLIHKLQTTHANTDSTKHFLSPLTVSRWQGC